MKNGRWIGITVAIIVLAGIAVWWWNSSASDPVQEDLAQTITPELSIANARITDISDEKISLTSEIVLKNSYPVEISSSRMEYEVFIDSIRVIQDQYDEPFTINSSDSTAIEVPMEILADPMGRVLDYFEEYNIDSAHYALETRIFLDVPIEGEEEFSMNISDTLPAMQMLDMKIEEIETNMLSSDEGLIVVMNMTNPNSYPIKYLDGSFSFTVKDELEVVGQIEDITIPAGGSENITVKTKKEWGSFTQTGQDYIFNQSDTRFVYVFNGHLSSDNDLLDDTEMNMTVEGTLDELSDIMGL